MVWIMVIVLGLATLILAVFPDKPYVQVPLTILLVVVLLFAFNMLGGGGGDDNGGGRGRR